MIWDPYTTSGRQNLRLSIAQSWKDLQPHRDIRRRVGELYVGNYYGKQDVHESEKQLMALITQAASVYVSWLAAEAPIARVKTDYVELKRFAKRYEINLNNVAKKIKISDTLRELVLESTFKIGIAKVALGSSEFVRMDDDSYSDPGFPFVASIDLDNWVHDMKARSLREARYMGDYYEIGEDALEAEKMFNKKTRDKLLNQVRENEDRGRRMSDLSNDRNDYDLFCSSVKLIDIWIPRQRKVYTFDANLDYAPLHVVDYDPPSEGPYKFLFYDDVPGNSMPVSPLENLIDLSDVVNSLLRKNVRRARAMKELTGFRASSKEDAEAVRMADDGEFVRIDDPSGVAPIRNGTVDQNLFNFNLSMLENFNRMGGNIMTLAGLGAQTKTVGQEQLLNEQVGALMQKMQRRVVGFCSEVYGEVGIHVWNDAVGYRANSSMDQFGLPEMTVDRSWNPGEREGDVLSYAIEVEPNSMVFQSPTQKMQIIDDFVLNKAMPLSQTPSGQQEGMAVSLKSYVETASDLHNVPQLREIIKFTGQQLPDPPKPDQTSMPKKNGGVYIHKGAGGQPKDPQLEIMDRMKSSATDNNQ